MNNIDERFDNLEEKYIQTLRNIKCPRKINGEINLKYSMLFKFSLIKWLDKHPEKSVGEVLLLLEKYGFIIVNGKQTERSKRKEKPFVLYVPPNVSIKNQNFDLGFAVMDIKETRAAMDINENTAAEEAKLKYWKRYGRK